MSVSYSQLSTYKRCPRQYEFEYVKGVFRPISQGESFGASMHNALKRWGELEMAHANGDKHIDDGKSQLGMFDDPTTHQHLDALSLTTLLTYWRACFIGDGYSSRAEIDMKIKQGEAALTEFFGWWSKEPRSVVGIEKAFKLELETKHGQVVLSGRIDRIERSKDGLHVIDYKSSQARPQNEVDADLQLSVYALAVQQLWKEPVQALSLLFISEEEMIERKTERNESQLKDATTLIGMMCERMETKDFKPTPSAALCRHCPFRDICDARAA